VLTGRSTIRVREQTGYAAVIEWPVQFSCIRSGFETQHGQSLTVTGEQQVILSHVHHMNSPSRQFWHTEEEFERSVTEAAVIGTEENDPLSHSVCPGSYSR